MVCVCVGGGEWTFRHGLQTASGLSIASLDTSEISLGATPKIPIPLGLHTLTGHLEPWMSEVTIFSFKGYALFFTSISRISYAKHASLISLLTLHSIVPKDSGGAS